MRKLEGIVKEMVEEMEFLKRREERFQSTNGSFFVYILTTLD
jgi:p24 family protein delta-1